MKKKIVFLILMSLFQQFIFAQEFGDPSRTEVKDNAGEKGTKSGFFQTVNPVNYPTGAGSWWHY